jgi:Zn-dependent alcohol dehydrogenase
MDADGGARRVRAVVLGGAGQDVEITEVELDLDSLVSARRPLDEAADALDDLAAGRALRTLLTAPAHTPTGRHDVHSH